MNKPCSYSEDECCWVRIAVYDVRKQTVFICCGIHSIRTTLPPQYIDTFPNKMTFKVDYYGCFWNIFLPKKYIIDWVVNWNPMLPFDKDDRFMFYHLHSDQHYDGLVIVPPCNEKLYQLIDPILRVNFAS